MGRVVPAFLHVHTLLDVVGTFSCFLGTQFNFGSLLPLVLTNLFCIDLVKAVTKVCFVT